jgi:hypothetical protein
MAAEVTVHSCRCMAYSRKLHVDAPCVGDALCGSCCPCSLFDGCSCITALLAVLHSGSQGLFVWEQLSLRCNKCYVLSGACVAN